MVGGQSQFTNVTSDNCLSTAKEIAQSLKDATGTMGSADVTERARFQKLKRTLEKEIKKTQGLAERIADHERRALFEAKRQSPSSTLRKRLT